MVRALGWRPMAFTTWATVPSAEVFAANRAAPLPL